MRKAQAEKSDSQDRIGRQLRHGRGQRGERRSGIGLAVEVLEERLEGVAASQSTASALSGACAMRRIFVEVLAPRLGTDEVDGGRGQDTRPVDQSRRPGGMEPRSGR